MAASKKKLKKKKVATKKKVVRRVVKKAAKKKVVKKKVTRRVVRKVHPRDRKKTKLDLIRHQGNPILAPQGENHWEARAAFNPTALLVDGKIHILYRAIGADDRSVIGYAASSDGFHIDKRLPHPVYLDIRMPKAGYEIQIPYSSGGGTNGGSEDPRVTLIGDRVYMIYTAFDGWGSLRLDLTSIRLDNFLNHVWKWKSPVHISPPGEIHKNWTLFPEKIGGKFAILHSIVPNIGIAYFDNLDELDGESFIKSSFLGGGRKGEWDNRMRGVGPAPIKTKHGWLVLYHAMDKNDPNRYKLGAMLLDLADPNNILYRSNQPILEPDEWYENQGFKSGVVYCCGAVVKDSKLIVYYGGADTVACAAVADLDIFLRELMRTGKTKLKRNVHR